METEFHKKYVEKITGTISCYDRIIISGSLNSWGYSEAMEFYLFSNGIKIFDFPMFAKKYNEKIREQIERVASKEGIEIEHIRNPGKFDKESNIKKIIQTRGNHQGIVHIFTSMEICTAYEPTWNKASNKAKLVTRTTKCLNYYIYFIDKILGLCFLRIPTWIPCQVQFYCNGHNYLANKLQKHNINFIMEDNAFIQISDYEKAQKLSDDIRVKDIHQWFDIIINRFIPFLKETSQYYRWSLIQTEYATDIIFKEQNNLKYIYDDIILQSIHSVKPENIATFFSRALAANYNQEVGTKYNKQIQGTRIKHYMGANSIKMYDKSKTVLRIETTVNNIKEFKIFRDVNTRNGHVERRLANMKKSIYSLYDLSKQCLASNMRYLDFLATFGDNSEGKKNLYKISQKKSDNDRSYKGFNFFDLNDAELLSVLFSGEFNINGFRNKSLRGKLNNKYNSSQISRILKRLYILGLIKKIKNSYKYYLTKLGKKVISAGLVVKELNIIPALS